MVYSRDVGGKKISFGVSGRLYKSNVLFYDHQTESLWSQLMNQAVSGDMAGMRLEMLPAIRTDWKTWKKNNPDTLVLSTDTGYSRDYAVDPYEGYYRTAGIWFPVGDVRKDLSPKEKVLGIEQDGRAMAYPLEIIRKNPGTLENRIGNHIVRITIDKDGQINGVFDSNGSPVPHLFVYWFAWQAFYPKTEVYRK